MSADYERLIGRAVTDKAFRDKVLADPRQAAKDAGFNLTGDELDSLEKNVQTISGQVTTEEIDRQFSSAAAAWWNE